MKNSTISVYDKIASQYALSFKEKPEEKELIEEFISKMPSHAKILDVGCGNADYYKLFQEHEMDYIGIDLSENMINVARKQNPKGKFLVQDMLDLDFSVGEFDGVFCFYSLIHISNSEIGRVLSNINFVLNPEGKVLLSVQEGEGEVFIESQYTSEGKIYVNLFSESKIVDILQQFGFKILRLRKKEPKSKNELPYNKMMILLSK